MLDYFDHCMWTGSLLPADNYSGQNTNITMMQYPMWWALLTTIYLLFVGQLAPYSCFELLKREFWKMVVSRLAGLGQIVQSLTVVNEYVAAIIISSQTGELVRERLKGWSWKIFSWWRKVWSLSGDGRELAMPELLYLCLCLARSTMCKVVHHE